MERLSQNLLHLEQKHIHTYWKTVVNTKKPKELMFENYKDSLFNDKITLKSQKRFKSACHEVYTEEVNKIA